MNLRNWKHAALALAAIGLAACGGGSSNDSAPTFSSGPITRFGSVVVNGVEWSVTGATLRMDDTPNQTVASEDNIRSLLREGSVVRIRGSSNGVSGVATEIEFRSVVEGPVGTKGTDSFTIAGLTVAVDANTKFFDSAGTAIQYAGIAVASPVEVSGFPESATVLNATMVRLKNSGQPEYEAKGFVVNLSGSTFGLSLVSGGAAYLTVNAAGTTLPAGLAANSIAEAKGLTLTGNTLTATLVRLEDRLFGNANTRAEVEGIVTGYSGGSSFVVNGQQVTLASNVRYVGGINGQADLANGVKVEAEGGLDGSGNLVADKVKFKDAVRIQAVAGGTPGAVTMLGLNVVSEPGRTQAEGGAALAPGQALEIRGTPLLGGNRIFAQRVRAAGGNSGRPFLQGVVTANTPTTSVTILDRPLATGAATQYRNSLDQPVGAGAFYAAIVNGQTIVKIVWNEGGTITDVAREAELEDD